MQDLTLIDLQCNGWSEGGVVGSAPAALVATAAAGSQVVLKWTMDWPSSHVVSPPRTFKPSHANLKLGVRGLLLDLIHNSHHLQSDGHLHGQGPFRHHSLEPRYKVRLFHC